MNAKKIPVSCAILEMGGRILALRRKKSAQLGGKWEFPGGKIEPGESPDQCLKRELKEELDLSVDILEALPLVQYTYPHAEVLLHPFICFPKGSLGVMQDHDELVWDDPKSLGQLAWAPADRLILELYIKRRG